MSGRKAPEAKIEPASLRDMPSVLDTQQACDVLRMGEKRLQELTSLGLIHRLSYRREYLYATFEIRRFLSWATEVTDEEFAAAVSQARDRRAT